MGGPETTELTIPDGQWMSHAFISKIAAQVSLPYKRPKEKIIERRNGGLTVKFSTSEDCLPYGKWPRLFELWACTMIKTGAGCFDPETNTLSMGTTFREFMRAIGSQVGGRQLHDIKAQLERLFSSHYTITSNTQTTSTGINFVVARTWHIDWLSREPQDHALFENTVRLSDEYVDMLRDHPVPVDLKAIAKIRKPMALDIYWWLTKRVYDLHEPVSITWPQLYQQFGSDSDLRKFKQNFKQATAEVLQVYDVKITIGPQRVTIYPSDTSVPTSTQRAKEITQARKRTTRSSSSETSTDTAPSIPTAKHQHHLGCEHVKKALRAYNLSDERDGFSPSERMLVADKCAELMNSGWAASKAAQYAYAMNHQNQKEPTDNNSAEDMPLFD